MSETDPKDFYKRFGMPGDHALADIARANRHAQLKELQGIREGTRPAPRETALGRVALRIPDLDFAVLRVRFPDLASPDNETRHKAWLKFIKNPLSEPYRVYRKW